MSVTDFPEPANLRELLILVSENTIYECALPPMFQSAMDQDLIHWQYSGAWNLDWLALTDKGRAKLGLLPEETIIDELSRTYRRAASFIKGLLPARS